MTTKTIWWAIAAYLAVACLAAPAATLVLEPASGAINGNTGNTVGWGFTVTHTPNWIVITSASFCAGTSGVQTACIPMALGTFTDYISTQSLVLVGPSPNSTAVTQTFDSGAQTGIGGFQIIAASGQATGQIVLTYDVFSRSPDDPAFDPDTDTVSTDNFLTASASVTAAAPPPVTPLPPSLWLMLTAMLWLAGHQWWTRRRRAGIES